MSNQKRRMGSIAQSMTAIMDENKSNSANVADVPVIWTLVSGRKVSFLTITIPAEDVERLTRAHEHNRRLQSELKTHSLVKSIARQQYQSCIATLVDGIYELSDGTRRRDAAIKAQRPLRVMYCKEVLTTAEVKGLTKELQSAEEHSARDHGAYFEYLLNHPTSPMTKDQIIEEEGISEAKYERCMRAWEVPQKLVDLFEHPKELGDIRFRKLKSVASKFIDNEALEAFTSTLDIQPGTSTDEVLAFIVEAAGLKKSKSSDKPRKFVDIDKNRHVKIKKSGKAKTIFEVSNGSEREIEDIERLIAEYYQSKQKVK
jgi:ParB family transcriptional regulator, chromosome partitioning protein